jgi:hypothetical protein
LRHDALLKKPAGAEMRTTEIGALTNQFSKVRIANANVKKK